MTEIRALSVLDLSPLRDGQASGDALAATTALAQCADALGLARYWVAEHHNMPAIAATAPPVQIAHLAAATQRIRVGSGGVMLPNHSALEVAEQFAMLEALHADRIDLGIGRAPGTDQVTAQALQRGMEVENFPSYLRDVLELLGVGEDGDGERGVVRVPIPGRADYELRATPRPSSAPAVWLLGSSDFSARLAAALGLPYVFATHFGGTGTTEALEQYRAEFRATTYGQQPKTFITANVVVAPTDAEAEELALPQKLVMARLRTGAPLTPVPTVEQAHNQPPDATPAMRSVLESVQRSWIVGTPAHVADRLAELAGTYGVDEVMVNPNAGEYDGTDLHRAPNRERSLALLTEALRGLLAA